MKNLYGLGLAFALGLAAAMLNFVYLNKSPTDEKIDFVGIKKGETINAGEPFSEAHFTVVSIPKQWAGVLGDHAVLDSARKAVLGQKSWRTLSGPRLLLSEDLKAPPPEPELKLAEGEASIGVPVDSRAYPLTLVVPGDRVSFLVSKFQVGSPTPAVAAGMEGIDGPGGFQPAGSAGPTETIGPFDVLSLGNRLGTLEVMKANRIAQVQGNVMTVRVRVGKDNELTEEKAKRLVDILLATKFREVGILHFPQNREPAR